MKQELVDGGGRNRSTRTEPAPKNPPPGADLLVSGAADTQINGFYKCVHADLGPYDSEPDKYYHLEVMVMQNPYLEDSTIMTSLIGEKGVLSRGVSREMEENPQGQVGGISLQEHQSDTK